MPSSREERTFQLFDFTPTVCRFCPPWSRVLGGVSPLGGNRASFVDSNTERSSTVGRDAACCVLFRRADQQAREDDDDGPPTAVNKKSAGVFKLGQLMYDDDHPSFF